MGILVDLKEFLGNIVGGPSKGIPDSEVASVFETRSLEGLRKVLFSPGCPRSAEAGEMLLSIGTPQAVEILVFGAKNFPWLEDLVVKAGPRAVPALASLLEEPMDSKAPELLVRIGPSAIKPLLALYSRKNQRAQGHLTRILKTLGYSGQLPPPKGCPPKEETPGPGFLDSAIIRGDEETALSLIEAGQELDPKNLEGNKPIHTAVRYGRLRILEALLGKKVSVNTRGENMETPIHTAARFGQTEAVELLLKYGASLTSRLPGGDTPLHVAAVSGQIRMVEALLEKGVSLNIKNEAGLTPLDRCFLEGSQEETVSLLLKKKAVPSPGLPYHLFEKRSREGFAMFKKAGFTIPQEYLLRAIQANDLPFVDALLKAGMDPNRKGPFSCGAFFSPSGEEEATLEAQESIRTGDFSLANVRSHGYDYSRDSTTPLHGAAAIGNLDILERLFKNGADPGLTDEWGATCLHVAALAGHADVVTRLLEGCRVPDIRDDNRETPFHWACRGGASNIVELLVGKGVDWRGLPGCSQNGLGIAAHEGHEDLVKWLEKKGLKIDVCDSAGNLLSSAILEAASSGHGRLVEYLVARVPGSPAIGVGFEQAIRSGKVEIARILLRPGVPVQFKFRCQIQISPKVFGEDREWLVSEECTPLLLASAYSDRDLVMKLLEMGADPHHRDENGRGVRDYWGQYYYNRKSSGLEPDWNRVFGVAPT